MKLKLPLVLSVLSMFLGVCIAILFGVNEKIFKNKIALDLQKNQKIISIVDAEKRNQVVEAEKSKNWRYYQRFHFHATGIGAMSLAAVLLFQFILAPIAIRLLGSYFISVGGFLYPFVWLFAAIYGPIMGRTEAKEAFAFFGYMGGVFLVGLLILIYTIIRYPVNFSASNKQGESCCN